MKRTLYLRGEVEAPDATYDPMLSLSDVATWAECHLNHDVIQSRVTAYSDAQHIVQDEAEGVFATSPATNATK